MAGQEKRAGISSDAVPVIVLIDIVVQQNQVTPNAILILEAPIMYRWDTVLV